MSKQEEAETGDCCERLRQLVNAPRRKYRLCQSPERWLQVCASLDVIEDSELAIRAFDASKLGGDIGGQYLMIYGLLQAIFVQQDALVHLGEALEVAVRLEEYPRLQEIREIRHDLAGHPTRRDQDRSRPTPSFHFLTRRSVGGTVLRVNSRYGDGRSEYRSVALEPLIADQRQYASEALRRIIDHLENEDVEYRERFRTEKLADLFLGRVSWGLAKMHEGCDDQEASSQPIASFGLEEVEGTLSSFREALSRRNVDLATYPAIENHYQRLDYPMSELRKFFSDPAKSVIADTKMGEVFVSFVESEIRQLKEIAVELDHEIEGAPDLPGQSIDES